MVGLCLGYAGTLAQARGTTTHLLATNFNRILVLLIGSVAFGETLGTMQWVSALVSIVGTVAYSLG